VAKVVDRAHTWIFQAAAEAAAAKPANAILLTQRGPRILVLLMATQRAAGSDAIGGLRVAEVAVSVAAVASQGAFIRWP
jgi:hypothetical protein